MPIPQALLPVGLDEQQTDTAYPAQARMHMGISVVVTVPAELECIQQRESVDTTLTTPNT